MLRRSFLAPVCTAISLIGANLTGHSPIRADARHSCCPVQSVLRPINVDQNAGSLVVDTRTGHVLILSRTPIPSATNVFNDRVSVFDVGSGQLIRTVALGRDADGLLATTSLAVDPRTGYAFALSNGPQAQSPRGLVTVLDARDGAVLRTVAVPNNPVAVAIDAPLGRAFVTSLASYSYNGPPGQGYVSMLDIRTGRVLRTVVVGLHPQSLAVDTRTHRVFVANSDVGTISVLDARSGTLLRTVTTGGPIQDVGVDEQTSHVMVATYNPPSYSAMLDARTGRVLHRVAFNADIISVNQHAGRAFFAVEAYNAIGVIDTRTGTVLHVVSSPQAATGTLGNYITAVASDDQTGQFFVLNQAGTLRVIDGQSGHIRRTIPVGPDPRAIAVDVQRDRLVVADRGDHGLRVLTLANM